MRIFFNKCEEPDSCMSSCLAMVLDMEPLHVYASIHERYQATTDADQEKELLKEFLDKHGLVSSYHLPHELDEGLYVCAIVSRSENWHAVLLSIYKDEVKMIDPDMFSQKTFYGFDEEAYDLNGVYPILKIEWEDYVAYHGDKVL